MTITNPVVLKIRDAIRGTEFEGKTYIAGGFVRDAVMKLPESKDIDIVVELPNGGISLAQFLSKKLNLHSPVTYERFGTAMVTIDGIPVEFVMTRKEVYTKGSRKPKVSFGTLKDDSVRRDFTINSMFMDVMDGKILDMTGLGVKDIYKKMIRATSDPEHIFGEDPLRMLRALRFASRFGFDVAPSTFMAIHDSAQYLDEISRERVRDEFMKIISAPDFEKGIRMMLQTGLMNYVLPEFTSMEGINQGKYHIKDPMGHTFDVMRKVGSEPLKRLAALLHDIGKPEKMTNNDGEIHFYMHDLRGAQIAEKFMTDLRFSADDIDTVVTAVRNHMPFKGIPSMRTIRRMRMKFGDKMFQFIMDLVSADKITHVNLDNYNIKEIVNKMIEEDTAMKNQPKPPVNGNDIMKMFNIVPGPQVGQYLEIVNDIFCDNPEMTKEQMLAELKNRVDAAKTPEFTESVIACVEKLTLDFFD
jgi:poly(A) polymerase